METRGGPIGKRPVNILLRNGLSDVLSLATGKGAYGNTRISEEVEVRKVPILKVVVPNTKEDI